MGNYTTYIGMDVHARSIDCSAIDVAAGEGFRKVFAGNPAASEVDAWVRALPQPAYCAHGSGCTGLRLCRDLRELGTDCDAVAVSTLAKSPKDRKGKCDKNDARAIRREIANPDRDHGVVWVLNATFSALPNRRLSNPPIGQMMPPVPAVTSIFSFQCACRHHRRRCLLPARSLERDI